MSIVCDPNLADLSKLSAAVANLPEHRRGFKSREQKLLDAMQVLAKGFDITMADLRSKRRYRKLSRCRELIAYVLHDLREYSYPEIGRAMGKHHTSVLYAARRFRERQVVVERTTGDAK